jgi:hypothetical protein
MPHKFWGEAVMTAVYVLNRSFTRSMDDVTPFEAWHEGKPDVEHLRVFGCVAHAKVTRPGLKKLDDRSTPMVFLGYEQGSKAYRLFDPVANRVHVSRDVVFDEDASWDWSISSHTNDDTPFVVEYLVHGGAHVPAAQAEPASASGTGDVPEAAMPMRTGMGEETPGAPPTPPSASTPGSSSSSMPHVSPTGIRFVSPPRHSGERWTQTTTKLARTAFASSRTRWARRNLHHLVHNVSSSSRSQTHSPTLRSMTAGAMQ